MASIKLYLDTRRPTKEGEYPLKLAISHNQSSSYITTGISLNSSGSVDFQWGIISSCLAVPGDTRRCCGRRAWRKGGVNE